MFCLLTITHCAVHSAESLNNTAHGWFAQQRHMQAPPGLRCFVQNVRNYWREHNSILNVSPAAEQTAQEVSHAFSMCVYTS